MYQHKRKLKYAQDSTKGKTSFEYINKLKIQKKAK